MFLRANVKNYTYNNNFFHSKFMENLNREYTISSVNNLHMFTFLPIVFVVLLCGIIHKNNLSFYICISIGAGMCMILWIIFTVLILNMNNQHKTTRNIILNNQKQEYFLNEQINKINNNVQSIDEQIHQILSLFPRKSSVNISNLISSTVFINDLLLEDNILDSGFSLFSGDSNSNDLMLRDTRTFLKSIRNVYRQIHDIAENYFFDFSNFVDQFNKVINHETHKLYNTYLEVKEYIDINIEDVLYKYYEPLNKLGEGILNSGQSIKSQYNSADSMIQEILHTADLMKQLENISLNDLKVRAMYIKRLMNKFKNMSYLLEQIDKVERITLKEIYKNKILDNKL